MISTSRWKSSSKRNEKKKQNNETEVRAEKIKEVGEHRDVERRRRRRRGGLEEEGGGVLVCWGAGMGAVICLCHRDDEGARRECSAVHLLASGGNKLTLPPPPLPSTCKIYDSGGSLHGHSV